MHLNELPFRAFFNRLDGTTSGPTSFKGTIGQEIRNDLTLLSFIDFTPIMGKVKEISYQNELSTDQRYLYDMCIAVQSGVVNPNLAVKSPGNINHARWLTRANRILRLDVSTKNPEENLVHLVSNILNLYAPGWFHIKSHPLCTQGAPNFFFLLSLSQQLPAHDRYIQTPVFQRNSYFAHSENILLAAVVDENKEVRRNAITKIIDCRQSESLLRQFNIPQSLNINASNYIEMIDWEKEAILPPPILQEITDDDLICGIEKILKIPPFLCHTQNVERGVKIVTEASSKVFGYEARVMVTY